MYTHDHIYMHPALDAVSKRTRKRQPHDAVPMRRDRHTVVKNVLKSAYYYTHVFIALPMKPYI